MMHKIERILVTGGAGFVGSVLVDLLMDRGYCVTVYDNRAYGAPSFQKHLGERRFSLVEADIRDATRLRYEVAGCDAIIHLAALVGAPACSKNPEAARSVNVGGTRVLNDVRQVGTPFVHVSTGSVYGKVLEGICTEETQPKPLSEYGVTKLEGERISSGNGAVVFRPATAFGVSPTMRLDLLVNDLCHQALHEGALVLYESRFWRTFIHVRDFAKGIIFGIENYSTLADRVFNLGSDNREGAPLFLNGTKLAVARLIAEHTGCAIRTEEIGIDADQRDYRVSYRAVREAGFSASTSLRQGIREMIPILRGIDRGKSAEEAITP